MALTTAERVARVRAYYAARDLFVGSAVRPNFRRAVLLARRELNVLRNGPLARNVSIRMNPADAVKLSYSREVRDYMMQGPLWWEGAYGLPRTLYGYTIDIRQDQPEGRVDMWFEGHRIELEC